MKRIVSIVLLACLLCGLFAGCKAKKQANTATDIEVIYWDSGYGRAWLDNVVKEFNDRQDKYHATVVASAENRGAEANRGDATGDLYLVSFNSHHAYIEYLHPLNDLLSAKVDGEDGLTIGEKFGDFVDVNKHPNGNVYALPIPMGDFCALMYNADMMVDANGNPYKLPNTTDELTDLCLSLYSDGKTPIIHYSEYWRYLYEAWTAQYDGIDKYLKSLNAVYVDENGEEHPNDVRLITESKGRLEAYRALEDLVSPKGYTYTNCNSFTHTIAQTYFVNGYAVMMPNGLWMENEMSSAEMKANILPMRTPVLSALADKLGIKSDKHLSLIVDYVDGTQLSDAEMAIVNGYSAEVIEEVRIARTTYYAGQPYHTYIPSYSNCIDGAMELMKFMYSDEGLKIAEESVGVPLGLTYSADVQVDDSNWSPFMRECNKLRKGANVIRHYINPPVYYLGGVAALYLNDPVRAMTYRADGGTLNADKYWAKEVADWEVRWPQMLTGAGLQ